MRYKYAFHPEDYCVGENELFYTEMAAKGWRLLRRGAHLSEFERAEPSGEVYRVEVDYREFSEERLELYSQCGWELVTKRGYINVLRGGAGTDAPELYSDPTEQADTVRRMRRRSILTNLAALTLLVPYLALIISIGSGVRGLAASLTNMLVTLPGIPAAYTVLLVNRIANSAEGTVRISRLIKRLKGGRQLDHAPKRRGTAHIWVVLVLVAMCFGTVAVQLIMYKMTAPMPVKSDGVYITLADLGYTGQRCGVLDAEEDSRVEKIWSPLADVTYARETVTDDGSDWISMDQDIYELRVPALSELLALSLMERSIFTRNISEYREIDVPSWDTVRAASLECVAVRGGTVARVYILMPDGTTMEQRRETFAEILTMIAGRVDKNEDS